MEVYCTNPRCLQPKNQSNGDVTNRNSITAKFCITCGMSLFIGREKRYIALEKIGQGGFGKTFKAYDFNFARECAIKVFHPQQKLTSEQLNSATTAFKNSSKILSHLNHRYIPRVYDFLDLPAPINNQEETISGNDTQQKLFFLIQDYIPGKDLKKELSRKKFPESDVVEVLKSLLQILKETHDQDVIHRDIKPSNIICHRDNKQLYLIDFDTAIKRDLEPGVPVECSFAIGTPGYAPPEQQSGKIDMSADLYALAATCIHLLTNKPPTEICNGGGSLHIWKNYLPHPINNRFADILDKMLALNPSNRFQSAQQVLEAINNLSITTIQGTEEGTTPSPPQPPFWVALIQRMQNQISQLCLSIQAFWRRWKRWIGFIILVVLALILALLFHTNPEIFSQETEKTPEHPPTPDNICPNYPSCPTNDNFSWGEEIMFSETSTQEKINGTEAFKKGEYKEAIKHFKKALNSNPNDPETLVYLNNALASVSSNTENLKIAVNIPITSNTNTAEEMLRGVAHVQSKLNCGIETIKRVKFPQNSDFSSNCDESGINGRRLKILITDYSTNSTKVENIYKQVANNPNILGVIGPFTSSETLQAGEIYSKEKLVLISPTSTAVRKIKDDQNSPDHALAFNKYVFRTSPTDSTAAKDLVEYMLKKQYKQPVIIVDGDGGDGKYSKSLSGELRKVLSDKSKNQNIKICNLSSNKNIAANCIKQALRENANVSMLALSHNQVNRHINTLGLLTDNKKIKVFLGGDGIYEKNMIKSINKNGKLVLAVPWHRTDGSTEEKSQFEKESEKLWNTTYVNWRTAMSYDATKAMAEGLKKDGYPTRESLFKKLSSDNFRANGANAPVQFDNTHDRKIVEGTGVLVKVQDSDFILLETPER